MEVETKPSKQGDLVDFNLDCLPFHQALEEMRDESKFWHMHSCSGRRRPRSSSSIISTSFGLVYGTQLHKAECCPSLLSELLLDLQRTSLWIQIAALLAEVSGGARVGCGAAPNLSAAPSACQVCPALGHRGHAAAAPEDTAEEPAQSCWFHTQQLLLHFPEYLICRLYFLLFFLMKEDFRSSAVDLELLKKN